MPFDGKRMVFGGFKMVVDSLELSGEDTYVSPGVIKVKWG